MLIERQARRGIRKDSGPPVVVAANTATAIYTPGAANTNRTAKVRKINVFNNGAGNISFVLAQGAVVQTIAFDTQNGLATIITEDQLVEHEYTAAIQFLAAAWTVGSFQVTLELEEFQGSTAHY